MGLNNRGMLYNKRLKIKISDVAFLYRKHKKAIENK